MQVWSSQGGCGAFLGVWRTTTLLVLVLFMAVRLLSLIWYGSHALTVHLDVLHNCIGKQTSHHGSIVLFFIRYWNTRLEICNLWSSCSRGRCADTPFHFWYPFSLDGVAQKIEGHKYALFAFFFFCAKSESRRHDWERTGRFAIWGTFIMGPILHQWYKGLEKLFPGQTLVQSVWKKEREFVFLHEPLILFHC